MAREDYKDPNEQLAYECGQLSGHPLDWIMFAFPWDTDESIQLVELQEPWASRYNCKYGPDAWFCKQMDDWGEHIRAQGFNGKDPVEPYQDATSSGHGIGKSAGTAMIILFILSTRPFSKGTVTAGNSTQLRTKTWAELGKWKAKCITGHWFSYTNSSSNMTIRHKDYASDVWGAVGYTCKEENSGAFAGQHAADSSSFYIFDEASEVPNKIWEVAEGGLTDGEPFWFVFGNPVRATGRFRECFRKFRHRWKHRHVDSRTVQITNKNQLNEMVKDHGEDSDYVKVRIRGVFPSQSVRQLIPEDLVYAARGRHLNESQYSFAPMILTCDPAWEGDDQLVIGFRQGLYYDILEKIPKNDNDVVIANKLARYEDELKADAVFIDLGYGTGIKSAGDTMGRSWTLVNFGEKSNDPGCFNKRAEMYELAHQWLKDGGAIPDDDELVGDLTALETVPRLDGKIQLESKKDMKKRGLPSTDCGDNLALTFAHPVVKVEQNIHDDFQVGKAVTDYNPIDL